QLMTFAGYKYPEGPRDPNGFAWLTATPNVYDDYSFDAGFKAQQAIEGWIAQELYHNSSAESKIAIWLHTCFIASNIGNWEPFEYWRLMFWGASNNLKSLAYKVTLDRMMLRYLNNDQNRKNSPNENYAREFLELFTIRRGPQIGPGNYTNYTEYDIQQAAKVLTGFTAYNSNFATKDPETGLAQGHARHNQHDLSDKTFSSAFGGQTITGATSEADNYRELSDFVNMVFNEQETARSFVRRAYRFFVSDLINPTVESQIIQPLATQLYTSGYQVKPMLTTLLKSQWFFDQDDGNPDDEVVGGKLKSDIDMRLQAMSFFKIPEAATVSPTNQPEDFYRQLWRRIGGEGIMHPASVEGYPGFYKEPSYSRFWFTSSSIVRRYSMVKDALNGRASSRIDQYGAEIDIVEYVENNFTDQSDAQRVVQQAVDYLLPEALSTERFTYFYELFLGSLSPINWMFEWQGYLGGGDPATVRNPLRRLFDALGSSPEYQVL
ncbi:MAG: DUF1800 family protein, partial [Bacteroidota bacterium]